MDGPCHAEDDFGLLNCQKGSVSLIIRVYGELESWALEETDRRLIRGKDKLVKIKPLGKGNGLGK